MQAQPNGKKAPGEGEDPAGKPLEPVFFKVADADEEERINEYRKKYMEFRIGKAFGAKGEVSKTVEVTGSDARRVTPPFIAKLSSMLENKMYAQYIHWNREGDTVVVKQLSEFATVVIPLYFKHNNFASFLRLLNMYHFSTTRQGHNWREFKNPLFKRGHPELHRQIKRKTTTAVPSSTVAAGGASEKSTKGRTKRGPKSAPTLDGHAAQDVAQLKGAMRMIVSDVKGIWKNLRDTNKLAYDLQRVVKRQQEQIDGLQRMLKESRSRERASGRHHGDSGANDSNGDSGEYRMPKLLSASIAPDDEFFQRKPVAKKRKTKSDSFDDITSSSPLGDGGSFSDFMAEGDSNVFFNQGMLFD